MKGPIFGLLFAGFLSVACISAQTFTVGDAVSLLKNDCPVALATLASEHSVLTSILEASAGLELLPNPPFFPPGKVVVLLAPTDQAFQNVLTSLNTTLANILSDESLVFDILTYHIGNFTDLAGTNITTVEKEADPIKYPQFHILPHPYIYTSPDNANVSSIADNPDRSKANNIAQVLSKMGCPETFQVWSIDKVFIPVFEPVPPPLPGPAPLPPPSGSNLPSWSILNVMLIGVLALVCSSSPLRIYS